MLKITINKEPEAVTLRLEGRLSGPWVEEVRKTWRSVAAQGSNTWRIDLRGLTHMSAEGKEMLADIRSQSGADFIADTPLTKYFADQAQRRRSNES